MCHPRLERLLILLHNVTEGQPGQIDKVVGAEHRTEALLAQGFEVGPSKIAGLEFHHVIPMLGNTSHVEQRKTDPVGFLGVLCLEEVVATIEPT